MLAVRIRTRGIAQTLQEGGEKSYENFLNLSSGNTVNWRLVTLPFAQHRNFSVRCLTIFRCWGAGFNCIFRWSRKERVSCGQRIEHEQGTIESGPAPRGAKGKEKIREPGQPFRDVG